MLKPLDKDALHRQFRAAKPFPHLVIDDLLEPDFLHEVVEAYPRFSDAWANAQAGGRAFYAVSEKLKVQVTDAEQFPEPVRRLHEALASDRFRADLSEITGIPKLQSDPALRGGGMHLTGPRGRLDVHVDFNYNGELQMHRRLNILVYLNRDWKREWGGAVELWNKDVTQCLQSVEPKLNRCVLFETSPISFHGVEPVTCPEGMARISFAGYYYTQEAPPNWDGTKHSTIFKPRPDEALRYALLTPIEAVGRRVAQRAGQAERWLKRWAG